MAGGIEKFKRFWPGVPPAFERVPLAKFHFSLIYLLGLGLYTGMAATSIMGDIKDLREWQAARNRKINQE